MAPLAGPRYIPASLTTTPQTSCRLSRILAIASSTHQRPEDELVAYRRTGFGGWHRVVGVQVAPTRGAESPDEARPTRLRHPTSLTEKASGSAPDSPQPCVGEAETRHDLWVAVKEVARSAFR